MAVPRRALLAATVVATGGALWFLQRGGEPAPVTDATPTSGAPDRAPPTASAPHAPAALTRVAELRALSETFRNTTFLTAIRAAGFVCYELANVYGGINDSATWTVNCADMFAYTVSVGAAGELLVEPTAQYLDGLPPTPPRDDRTPRNLPPPPR